MLYNLYSSARLFDDTTLPMNRQTPSILKGDVRDVNEEFFLALRDRFCPRIYNAALDACSSGGIHVMLLFMQAICQEAAAWHLLNFCV